jgi:hypothetical protein
VRVDHDQKKEGRNDAELTLAGNEQAQRQESPGQQHRNNNQTEQLKERRKREREWLCETGAKKGKKRQKKTMKAMNVPCRQAKPAAKLAPSARLSSHHRNNNQCLGEWHGKAGKERKNGSCHHGWLQNGFDCVK